MARRRNTIFNNQDVEDKKNDVEDIRQTCRQSSAKRNLAQKRKKKHNL